MVLTPFGKGGAIRCTVCGKVMKKDTTPEDHPQEDCDSFGQLRKERFAAARGKRKSNADGTTKPKKMTARGMNSLMQKFYRMVNKPSKTTKRLDFAKQQLKKMMTSLVSKTERHDCYALIDKLFDINMKDTMKEALEFLQHHFPKRTQISKPRAKKVPAKSSLVDSLPESEKSTHSASESSPATTVSSNE